MYTQTQIEYASKLKVDGGFVGLGYYQYAFSLRTLSCIQPLEHQAPNTNLQRILSNQRRSTGTLGLSHYF